MSEKTELNRDEPTTATKQVVSSNGGLGDYPKNRTEERHRKTIETIEKWGRRVVYWTFICIFMVGVDLMVVSFLHLHTEAAILMVDYGTAGIAVALMRLVA